ncbi:MAG: hypothetical protein JWO32_647 [Bacteroidetes bacterium]|nr:hypothetical protein [Bacteroidota bacterium]
MNYFTLIFSLLISSVCFFFSIKMIRLYLKVKKWSRVSARIISKEMFIHPKYSTSRSPYGIKAEYHYKMNDIEYSGHFIYLAELAGGQTNHMKSVAEKRLEKIEPTMLIYINPEDPKQSVMFCEGIGLYVFVFCMGVLSLFIGLGGMLI